MNERRKNYALSLDGQLPTPEQLRKLSRMATDAFLEIRHRTSEPKLVFALADAFHNLPVVMHSSEFKWSWLLMYLDALERDFPNVGHRYIAAFDEIVDFHA